MKVSGYLWAMNAVADWSLVVAAIALAIPATLALAAVTSPERAGRASGVALGLALLFAIGVAVMGGGAAAPSGSLGVRIDVVTGVLVGVVGALGAVIVRYSLTYLQGEPGLLRYLRWLLLTLSAVTALVIANSLLVMAIAWTATSLALHQLLTFYSDRVPALVAAHKKFLVSRLADVCLSLCLTLVYWDAGSFDLDRIAAWAAAHPQLTPSMHVAAVLLVVAVALRSAQLPFHGWLIQVMEAPTPVSALLHAGVVNIGGFVLIRLAPWMGLASWAQLLLVVTGLVSAIVAALVMTTRVSVKVALAWSTCAQMGFMLVECGLGLWHLAMLHLVAHSLYKAHAFLSAGSAVDDWRLKAMATQLPSSTSWSRLVVAALTVFGSAALCVAVWRFESGAPSPMDGVPGPLLALFLGLSLVPLVLGRAARGASLVMTAVHISVVVALWVGGHAVAGHLMPLPEAPVNALGWGLFGVGFAGLFAVKATLRLRPDGRLARTLYPWLFAGLYLDERFTVLTFRIWPPTLHRPSLPPRAVLLPEALEAH